MAKRLYLADNTTYQKGNKTINISVFKNVVRLGQLTQQQFDNLFTFNSSQLGGSIHLLDVNQAVGDAIAALPGIIEIPLAALDNNRSNLDGNTTVDQIVTRTGYDFRTDDSIRGALFQMIGQLFVSAGTSLD